MEIIEVMTYEDAREKVFAEIAENRERRNARLRKERKHIVDQKITGIMTVGIGLLITIGLRNPPIGLAIAIVGMALVVIPDDLRKRR